MDGVELVTVKFSSGKVVHIYPDTDPNGRVAETPLIFQKISNGPHKDHKDRMKPDAQWTEFMLRWNNRKAGQGE